MDSHKISKMNTTGSSDIYNDIRQLTHIPQYGGAPKFTTLTHPGRGTQDRWMNERFVRAPRNIELVEGNAVSTDNNLSIEDFPDEELLFSQIRQANGVDYSNHFIEKHVFEQDASSSFLDPETSSDADLNTSSSSETLKNELDLNHSAPGKTSVTQKTENRNFCGADKQEENSWLDPETSDAWSRSRHSKNALISGLLKKNFITLEDLDLQSPQNQANGAPSKAKEIQSLCDELDELDLLYDYGTEDPTTSDDFDFANFPIPEAEKFTTVNTLVPHPNEPEVFVHPMQVLQQGKNNSDDFTLQRLGEKKTVKPRTYFMTEIDDSSFAFHGTKPKSSEKAKKRTKKSNYKVQSYAEPVQTDFAPRCTFNPFAIQSDEFVLKKDDFPPL